MAQAGVFVDAQGLVYHDKKRRLWLASYLMPILAVAGPLMTMATGQSAWLWTLTLFNYGLLPLLDRLIGEDRNNPPESLVPLLEADPYYRNLVIGQVPCLWLAFIFGIWYSSTQPMGLMDWPAMVFNTGSMLGFALNLGHELGHKKTLLEKWMAKLVLALGFYGHFPIEHNCGHHAEVATPEDSASSRMGESLYAFMCREMPGGVTRAWRLEAERLRRRGLPVWSPQNEFLQPLAISILLYTGVLLYFGIGILPFLVVVLFWGAFQLTSANYVEHYGLLRRKDANGKYERCQPQHSWNSNHLVSNWITLHLQRHSDHHAHAARRYQSLRHFDNLPTLPSGYFGMFTLAYIPPLWFRVMNPRLVRQVNGDPERINFDPAKKAALMKTYQMQHRTG
jgi:alkane 1-monooxygenase